MTDAESAQKCSMTDREDIARAFHEAYERLAPSFGYATRKDSAVPWEDVPEQNKALMLAVVDELLAGQVIYRTVRLSEICGCRHCQAGDRLAH